MSILDALKNSVVEGFNTTLVPSQILLNLFTAVLAGLFILLVYRFVQRSVVFNRGFGLTLLLVTTISAMIVLTITSNLALSLGMVGALSIVRFRTAIKDASDTAFMFWAVAAGITAGAGFFLLSLIGCLVIALCCLVGTVLIDKAAKSYLLVVRANDGRVAVEVERLLRDTGVRYRMTSLVEDTAAELIYEMSFTPGKRGAVLAIRELDGVNSVSVVDCRQN